MCEKTRKALDELKTTNGNMTSGAKRGFNLMLDELERTNEKINTVDKKVDNLNDRFNIMETATAETLKIVNDINEKISVDKVEEKAAQMDFLQKIVGSKFGKIVITVLFCAVLASGVALVYFINNYKQVTEIVDSIKK